MNTDVLRAADAPSARFVPPRMLLVGASLAAVYVVWGSTFIAIKFALVDFPPLLMAAVRFLCAGSVLFAVARVRREPWPTARHWAASAATGVLLVGSNAALVFAEETVASGVCAMVMATIPMWMAVVGRLWGERTALGEWAGLAIGFAGVALLHVGGALGGGIGALVVLIAPITWVFGSIWSRHLALPGGVMRSASQMTTGGVAILAMSLARGERLTHAPGASGVLALAYLVVFGSVITFTAYNFLLSSVRPTVATSYAYVNPIVALALGALFAGEHVGVTTVVALGVTLGGVLLIARAKRSRA